MKNCVLLLGLVIFGTFQVKGQNDHIGGWWVCYSNENCQEDPLSLFMLIDDSTISYVTSMSTGLDPFIIGETTYSIGENNMVIVDTNSTGKVILNHFEMMWEGKNKLRLMHEKGENNLYLFREED